MPAKRLFLSVVLLVVPLAAPAQSPDTTGPPPAVRAAFDSIVTANTYHPTLDDGTLRGEGAQWLVERGQEAHHFMIGERHGTAEIPAVAGALYERLKPVGYDYAALEIGPFAARRVNAALDRGGFEALASVLTGYEAAPVAFLDWREEARLAARVHEAGGTIWGLDQEFSSSLPMHLDALSEQAETETERTAVEEMRTRMRTEWTEEQDYLGNASPDALRKLRRAFAERGDETALSRIDALIKSNAIYAPYTRDTGSFYHSGVDRENYMKRVLLDHLRRAHPATGASPKVFYKFGGLHSGRHPGATLDPRVPLGTFVAEWARTVKGQDSFHLFVDCNGGTRKGSGQGAAGGCPSALTAPARAKGKASPFSAHLSDDRVTLIDLTALRDRFGDWSFLTDRAQASIMAFDAYLAVPDVTPATPIDRSEPSTGND